MYLKLLLIKRNRPTKTLQIYNESLDLGANNTLLYVAPRCPALPRAAPRYFAFFFVPFKKNIDVYIYVFTNCNYDRIYKSLIFLYYVYFRIKT